MKYAAVLELGQIIGEKLRNNVFKHDIRCALIAGEIISQITQRIGEATCIIQLEAHFIMMLFFARTFMPLILLKLKAPATLHGMKQILIYRE